MIDSEKVEMSSCNLAETVHNKWLQESGNHESYLYIAIVDDFVRAFMQMVRINQYLKGNGVGTGPGKEELRLRVAQPLDDVAGTRRCSQKLYQAFSVSRNFSVGNHILRVKYLDRIREKQISPWDASMILTTKLAYMRGA